MGQRTERQGWGWKPKEQTTESDRLQAFERAEKKARQAEYNFQEESNTIYQKARSGGYNEKSLTSIRDEEEERRKNARSKYNAWREREMPQLQKIEPATITSSWRMGNLFRTNRESAREDRSIRGLLRRLPKNPPRLDSIEGSQFYKLWMDKDQHEKADKRLDPWALFDNGSEVSGYGASMNRLYKNLENIACPEGSDWNSSKLNWDKYMEIMFYVSEYLPDSLRDRVRIPNGMLKDNRIKVFPKDEVLSGHVPASYVLHPIRDRMISQEGIAEMSKDIVNGRPLILAEEGPETFNKTPNKTIQEVLDETYRAAALKAEDAYNKGEVPHATVWFLKFKNGWNVRLPAYSPDDVPNIVNDIFKLHYEDIEKAREIIDENERSYKLLESTVNTVRRLHISHLTLDGTARIDVFGVLSALLLQLQREFNCGFCPPIISEGPTIFSNCTPTEKLMKSVLTGMHSYNELFQDSQVAARA